MKRLSAALFLLCCVIGAKAQYCEPTFSNGCGLWNNQTIVIGDIDWTLDLTDCAISDYTDLSTEITPGVPTPMLVTNGHWCGCAVWVDLNHNSAFEANENLFYNYTGGDPSYDYNFDLTLPAGTPVGSYRMRVIAGWGSDGVTVGNNGYGPCGTYMYGNFDDFTLEVAASGVQQPVATTLIVGPNPTSGQVIINAPVDRIRISALDGRDLGEVRGVREGNATIIDLGAYTDGAYLLSCFTGTVRRTVRVVKN